MLDFIRTTGLFFWPIAGILILILVQAVRMVRSSSHTDTLGPRPDSLLFWGALAAVLGILGQCLGLYNGLRAISQATEIAPPVVAAGIAQSFQATFCGLTVLLIAGMLWLGLKATHRRRVTSTVAGLLLVIGFGGPSAATDLADLDEGGWVAEVGPDRFVFVFRPPAGDRWDGMSHSLRQGREYLQCPFTVEHFENSEIQFVMHKTGVRYRGTVDLAAGRIDGGLVYDDGGMDLPLTRIDPAQEPGMAARIEPYAYTPPTALDDGWATGDASAHGLATEAVADVVAAVCAGYAGLVHSVLVDHGGVLIVEEYFHGYDRETLHPLASVTKSVSGILVGMALADEGIEALQQPLLDFFPGAKPTAERWHDVTVEHLLTMSIGLEWSDEQAESVHGTGPDFFAAVLSLDFITEPGAVFRYVNANTNLTSGVVHEATGTFPEAFAADRLFTPLGIEHWDWSYGAEGGHRLMDGSLQLCPRDMMRLGRMMLDDGRWQGKQIVPREFARAAMTSHLAADAGSGMIGGYGYLWWTLRVPGADGPLDIAFANGWGSQFIIVVPTLDMVMVITGGNQDNDMHMAPQRVVALRLVEAFGAI